MSTRDIVLCHPVRTAIGTYSGSLKGTPATELGAIVVRETLRRAGLASDAVGSVIRTPIDRCFAPATLLAVVAFCEGSGTAYVRSETAPVPRRNRYLRATVPYQPGTARSSAVPARCPTNRSRTQSWQIGELFSSPTPRGAPIDKIEYLSRKSG